MRSFAQAIRPMKLVAQIFTSWNRMTDWLTDVDALQRAA
jgi:hypothetical protein